MTRAEELLQEVADQQEAFWDLLLELETELGVEIDGTLNLSETTVGELLEQGVEL